MLKTIIFGHRGLPAQFPENSLAGFRYAIENGVEGLEFDVQLTRDQVPVIMHDERIDRTTNGTGRLEDFRYAQLKQFQLVNGELIPTLDDFLALVAGQDVCLNLEFKTDKVQYPGIEALVLEKVSQADLIQEVIFSSFHLATLQTARIIAPDQNYCFLSDHVMLDPETFIRQAHLSGLHLNHYQPVGQFAERIWTVNSRYQLTTLFKRQVHGIFTDDFETAMQIRDQVQPLSTVS